MNEVLTRDFLLIDDCYNEYKSKTLLEIMSIEDKALNQLYLWCFEDEIDNLLKTSSNEVLLKQKELIKMYHDGNLSMEFLYMCDDKCLDAIYQDLYEDALGDETISSDYFPGKQVKFYPNIKEYRARKPITCAFSGEVIKPGGIYIPYRPMVMLLDKGDTYVLEKTIKCSYYNSCKLPKTFGEFEILNQKLEHSYTDDNDDVYELCCNIQSDHLNLLKLRKRKNG